MKEIRVFCCEVDLFRNNGFVFRSAKDRFDERSTKGVYFVAAKTGDEAKKILQNKIKFGSIIIPRAKEYKIIEEKPGFVRLKAIGYSSYNLDEFNKNHELNLKYKDIVKKVNGEFTYDITSAVDEIEEKEI